MSHNTVSKSIQTTASDAVWHDAMRGLATSTADALVWCQIRFSQRDGATLACYTPRPPPTHTHPAPPIVVCRVRVTEGTAVNETHQVQTLTMLRQNPDIVKEWRAVHAATSRWDGGMACGATCRVPSSASAPQSDAVNRRDAVESCA